MKNFRTALWLSLLGSGISSAIGLLVLGAFPQSWAATTYLWPGPNVAPLLSKIIPTAVVYRLVPDGGAPAFLMLILVGAFVSWTVLFVFITLVARRAWRPNSSFKADGSAAA
jgi:hypothetical protein